MNIFKLFGTIMVDNDKANKSLQKTDSRITKLTKGLGRGIKAVGKFGLAVTAGAAVAGGAVLGMAGKFAESTDRVDKMSQKLGLSREAFQEWDFILSQSGATVDGMQSGLSKLARSTDDLMTGTGAGAEAFNRLGISLDDVKDKTQEEIFEMTISALQNVTNESERTSISNDLLGRASSELAPIFNTNSEAIEQMRKQSHELGLIMGDETVDAGVKLQDSLDQSQRAFKAIGLEILSGMMPTVQGFLTWITENMPRIRDFISDAMTKGKEVAFVLWHFFKENVLPILVTLYSYIQEHMPQIKEFLKVAFETAVTAANEMYNFFNDNILPILTAFWELLDATVIPIVSSFVDIFVENFPILEELAKVTFDVLVDKVEDFLSNIKTLIDWVNSAIDGLKRLFGFDGKSVNVEVNENTVDNRTGGSGGKFNERQNYRRVDGHHRTGLSYVPFDGYVAELHRGEKVLTAKENDNMASTLNEILGAIKKMDSNIGYKFKKAMDNSSIDIDYRKFKRASKI